MDHFTARKVRYGSSIVSVSHVTILKYRSNIAGITQWATLCVRYSSLGSHTHAILERYSACDMDAIFKRYFSIVTYDILTILERYLTLQAVFDVIIYLGLKGSSIFTVKSDCHDLSRCSGSPLVEHAFITNGCMLMLAPLLPH